MRSLDVSCLGSPEALTQLMLRGGIRHEARRRLFTSICLCRKAGK